MDALSYFDAAKQALEIDTDYALAKHLNITQKRISAIKHGRSVGFDNETAIKIASILEIDPMAVIADMELLRKNANIDFWLGIKAKSMGTAAAILATVALSSAPNDAVALGLSSANSNTDTLCIMRVSYVTPI